MLRMMRVAPSGSAGMLPAMRLPDEDRTRTSKQGGRAMFNLRSLDLNLLTVFEADL